MEDLFNKDYPELLEWASLLIKKFKSNYDPLEIIANSFVKMIDSGEAYSKDKFRGLIYSSVWLEKGKQSKVTQYIENWNHDKKLPTDKQCKKCKEILPEAFFRVEESEIKKDHVRSVCIECEKEIDRTRKRINKPNSSKDASYYNNYRKLLPDSYIIDVLRKQGHLKENITSEDIINKRIQLYNKRMRLKKKAL